MGHLRLVALSLMALVLAGCGARLNHTASSDLAFDSKSETAVIVVGIGSGGKRLAPSGLLSTAMQDPPFRMIWASLDNSDDAVAIDFHNYRGGREHVSANNVIYTVNNIKPGRYMLVSILQEEKYGNQYVSRQTDTSKASTRLVFFVKPGDVVYLGDFTINAAIFPASISDYARNEQEARAALTRYPGIKGELRSVPVLPLPGPKREELKPL